MDDSRGGYCAGYTEGELAAVRRAIAPPPPAAPAGIAGAAGLQEGMLAFWKLADLAPDLLRRVAADPWARALAQYAFFPVVMEWRQAGRPIPGLRFTGRSRGPTAILRSGDEAIVIKPFQNTREGEIAGIAAAAGAGPAQLASLPGYLTERFAEGAFFTDLPAERRDAATMRAVGAGLGGMLRRLHDVGVYYNDATLADPEGRSHLIVDGDGGCTLIDFGVSVLVGGHPEYTREEVRNFARTLPMYRVFAGMAENRAEMDDFLDAYARQMARASRGDILARDLGFAQQGLAIAARRMGKGIIAPVREGFLAGYRPAAG